MVVFGEQGLIAQKRVKKILYQIKDEAQSVEDKNIQLQLKVNRLRSQKIQVILHASERLLSAPKGSVIYRFKEGE